MACALPPVARDQLVNDLDGEIRELTNLVAELVEESAEAFRPRADECGLAIVEEVEAGLPPVSASPERLQRVLFNLLANAVGHTPVGGTVTLRARRRAT